MLQQAPMYAYIPAKDLARARKFYEEKVGLKPKEENAGGVTYQFGKDTACATAGGAKAAWFKDSEGNILALVQPL